MTFRPIHRLLPVTTLAAGILAAAAVTGPSALAQEPGETWDVPNHSMTESGATIVTHGHVDIASRIVDGALTTVVKDDSDPEAGVVLRDPSGTVLQVRPEARTTVPSSSAYSFLGAPGSEVWMVTETEQEGLLWPGWSTELIPRETIPDGVEWRLERMEGPGEFTLFQTPLTGPDVLFHTTDGITPDDAFTIGAAVHAHGTWAFSAEGVYCLGFERAAALAGGIPASDDFTVAVAVGEVDVRGVDPAACFASSPHKPTEPDATPIDLDELNDANAGAVSIDGGASGPVAGDLVTAQVGTDRAATWVSVWLDDTSWLGWALVSDAGALQVRLPADAPAGPHVLVVEDSGGDLVGWASLLVTPADPGGGGEEPGGGDPDPGPDPVGIWDVPNGTVNAAGATVLNDGHVDIASLLEGGALTTRVKDTTQSASAPVWRDPARTVLQLLPDAAATVPAGNAWSFLGAAGSRFHQVSQTQQPGLLWPGWSTEAIPAGDIDGGVAWALTDISGPGHFSLYETAAFGQPSVLFATRDGITAADRFAIPENTHAHANWAFSAEGNYCLSMQRSARLANGAVVSHTFVLAVAVGTADVMSVDPARCGETVDMAPVDVPPPPPPARGADAAVPASQQVAATACVAGATVLSAGHIDYASRLVGGKLESLVGDDTSGTKVYREPSGTILWLKPSSAVTLPGGFGQVGAAGSRVWQVPQTQNPGLIWLGWNTEALNAGNVRGPVDWRINSVEGPGALKVYLTGSFGGVQQMVFSGPGAYSIPLGVHAHANWAFTAEGVYRINTTQTVTLPDGRRSSDTETLTIAVGDIDPRSAAAKGSGCGAVSKPLLLPEERVRVPQAAPQAEAAALLGVTDRRAGTTAAGDDGAGGPLNALVSAGPVPLLLGILGALLLLGAAGTGALWWRRGAGAGAQDR